MKKSCFFLFAAFLALSGCSDSADDNEVLDKDEPPVEFNGSQIFYTTIDDSKLSPNSSDFAVFGSNLLSNTYEDGQGVWTFEGTISRIGENAFKGCSSLIEFTISSTVQSIGISSFEGCTSLQSISIGSLFSSSLITPIKSLLIVRMLFVVFNLYSILVLLFL